MMFLTTVLRVLGMLLVLLLLVGVFLVLGNFFQGELTAGDSPPAVCPAPPEYPVCAKCIPYREPNYRASEVLDREADRADARGDRACRNSLIAVRFALMRDTMEDSRVLLDHMQAVLNQSQSADAGAPL